MIQQKNALSKSPTLHNLLQLACVLQIREDELLLRNFYLLFCLLGKVDLACGEIDLPSSLQCKKLFDIPTRIRLNEIQTHLLSKCKQLRLALEEK